MQSANQDVAERPNSIICCAKQYRTPKERCTAIREQHAGPRTSSGPARHLKSAVDHRRLGRWMDSQPLCTSCQIDTRTEESQSGFEGDCDCCCWAMPCRGPGLRSAPKNQESPVASARLRPRCVPSVQVTSSSGGSMNRSSVGTFTET